MSLAPYDFANILFAGPCNARCYFCIGQEVDPALMPDNLSVYPPQGLDAFIRIILKHGIRQVVFTGTNTDPQLYQHERRLLLHLRERLPADTQFSVHTNGRLALKKISVINLYDRAAISIPSFEADTYQQMMGVPGPPDLAGITAQATIPIKLSCLVCEGNRKEIKQFLSRCQALGIQRVVLRKRFGVERPWAEMLSTDRLGLRYMKTYRDNPVYDLDGMQVTLWDFGRSASRSVNLYASGVVGMGYLIVVGAVHELLRLR